MSGGYPGSSNSEEHENVIRALVKNAGVTTFVCLQCRDELEDDFVPYMPIAARVADTCKRPPKFKQHEESFSLAEGLTSQYAGCHTSSPMPGPVRKSTSFNSVIQQLEGLGDMESTAWSVESTHSNDTNRDVDWYPNGNHPYQDSTVAQEGVGGQQPRKKRSKTQTTEEELNLISPLYSFEGTDVGVGHFPPTSKQDSPMQSVSHDTSGYDCRGSTQRRPSEEEEEEDIPYNLTEHGITQLYFPIRDGSTAEDGHVLAFVQHLALRISKAMKLNDHNLSLLERVDARKTSRGGSKLSKFYRAKSSGLLLSDRFAAEDSNSRENCPMPNVVTSDLDGESSPERFSETRSGSQSCSSPQSPNSGGFTGARKRAFTSRGEPSVPMERFCRERGHSVNSSDAFRSFLRSSSDSCDASEHSDPSFLSNSVGNGSEDEGSLSRNEAVKRMKPHEVFYIHCYGGHGRTGTIVSLVLVALFGVDAETAMEYVNHAHRFRMLYGDCPSPESFDQVNQVRRLAPRLQQLQLASKSIE